MYGARLIWGRVSLFLREVRSRVRFLRCDVIDRNAEKKHPRRAEWSPGSRRQMSGRSVLTLRFCRSADSVRNDGLGRQAAVPHEMIWLPTLWKQE
jgi:hypothetical protein